MSAIWNLIDELSWSLGGDLKWLTTVCGLEGSKTNAFCIYCFCERGPNVFGICDKGQKRENWNFGNVGQKEVPLFHWINPSDIVICMLHLMLRIMDMQMEQALIEVILLIICDTTMLLR